MTWLLSLTLHWYGLNDFHCSFFLQDYVCPRCNSGFIEELERTHVSDSDSSSDTEMESFDMLDLIAQEPPTITGASASPASSSSVPGPRISQRLRHLNARHNRRRLVIFCIWFVQTFCWKIWHIHKKVCNKEIIVVCSKQ